MGVFDVLSKVTGGDGDAAAEAPEDDGADEADTEPDGPATMEPAEFREYAQRLADRSDVPELDFSEASLPALDDMASGNHPVNDAVTYGSYLGETLVNEFDGEWVRDDGWAVSVYLGNDDTTVAVFDAAEMAIQRGPVFEQVVDRLYDQGDPHATRGRSSTSASTTDEGPTTGSSSAAAAGSATAGTESKSAEGSVATETTSDAATNGDGATASDITDAETTPAIDPDDAGEDGAAEADREETDEAEDDSATDEGEESVVETEEAAPSESTEETPSEESETDAAPVAVDDDSDTASADADAPGAGADTADDAEAREEVTDDGASDDAAAAAEPESATGTDANAGPENTDATPAEVTSANPVTDPADEQADGAGESTAAAAGAVDTDDATVVDGRTSDVDVGEDPAEPDDAAPTDPAKGGEDSGDDAVAADAEATSIPARSAFEGAAIDFTNTWDGRQFDYSPASLARLDDFLDDQWSGRFREGSFADSSADPEEDEGPMVRVGAYVGEVLVREYDGEWVPDDGEPGVAVAGHNGRREVFPVFEAVRRSLIEPARIAYEVDAMANRLDIDRRASGAEATAFALGEDDPGTAASSADVITTILDRAEAFVEDWPEYSLNYRPASLVRLDNLAAQEFDTEAFREAQLGDHTDADALWLADSAAGASAYFAAVLVRHLGAQWEIGDEVVLAVEGPAGETTVQPFEGGVECLRQRDKYMQWYDRVHDAVEREAREVED